VIYFYIRDTRGRGSGRERGREEKLGLRISSYKFFSLPKKEHLSGMIPFGILSPHVSPSSLGRGKGFVNKKLPITVTAS